MRTTTAVRSGVLGFFCALLTVTAHTSAGGRAPGFLALMGVLAACSGLGCLVSRRQWTVGSLVVLFGGCQLVAHHALGGMSSAAPPGHLHGTTLSTASAGHSAAHSVSMALVHVAVAIVSAVLLCRAEQSVGLLFAIAEWVVTALSRLTPVWPSFAVPAARRPRVVADTCHAVCFLVDLAYGVSRRGPPAAPAPDPVR